MSRSRKRHPVSHATGATTDKPWKAQAHRAERHAVKAALTVGAEEVPDPRQFGAPAHGPKGDKHRLDAERLAQYPGAVRK